MFTQAEKDHNELLNVPYYFKPLSGLTEKKKVVLLILLGKSMTQFSHIKQKRQSRVVIKYNFHHLDVFENVM